MASVKEKRLNETTNNNVEIIIDKLEKAKIQLAEVFKKDSSGGNIIDEIRNIQCVIDEARKTGIDNSEPLTERVDKVLSNVNEAIIRISNFHEKYAQSLPRIIFDNLNEILDDCKEQLNIFKKKLEFIKISIKEITEISKLKTKLDEHSNKQTFQIWAIAIEKFGEGLEDFLDIYPDFQVNEVETFIKEILVITAVKKRQESRKESYRRRLRYAGTFIINLIESKKSYLSHEEEYEISEDQDKLIEDLMILSESGLDEFWLAPGEDEAWKNLLDT